MMSNLNSFSVRSEGNAIIHISNVVEFPKLLITKTTKKEVVPPAPAPPKPTSVDCPPSNLYEIWNTIHTLRQQNESLLKEQQRWLQTVEIQNSLDSSVEKRTLKEEGKLQLEIYLKNKLQADDDVYDDAKQQPFSSSDDDDDD